MELKLAAKRAREQRGVTVFVVMTAISILTATGLLAMHFSGLAVQASGYARAATQTLYTAELGLISGSAFLSLPGSARAQYQSALAKQNTTERDTCRSAPGTASFCKSVGMNNLDETIAAKTLSFGGTAYTLLDQTAGGSLGPFAASSSAGLQGDFYFEMTEPRSVTLPGDSTGIGTYQTVTLTSYGTVRPGGGASAICSGARANNAAATMLGMRAHMVIGPLD